jgi:hypothetical protein
MQPVEPGGKNRRRVLAALLTSALLISAMPGLANFKGYPSDKKGMSLEIGERGAFNSKFSEIFLVEEQPDGGSTVLTTCLEFGAGDCDPAGFGKEISAMGYLVMPPCLTELDRDCIESLDVGFGQELKPATLIREVAGIRIPANPRYGIPASGMPSLWQVPGVMHQGGADTYAVQFLTEIFIENGVVRYDFVSALVKPYLQAQELGAEAVQIRKRGTRGTLDIYRVDGPRDDRVFQELGVIGIPKDFAPGTKVKLTIRAAQQVGGWLRSRLDAPEVQVTPIDQKYNRVSVTGGVVEVPHLRGIFNAEEWSRLVQKPGLFNSDFGEDQAVGVITDDGFAIAKAIVGVSNDTAERVSQMWSFSTLNLGTSTCYADKTKLQGIVNTNAAVYGSSAPPLVDGFLSYRVAGAHYLPSGELAKGSYDLIIRSDLARCLYGFSKAPISAMISVYGGADAQVATTSVRERDGWITLTARNFTFSEKLIRARITQQQLATIAAFSAKSKTLTSVQKSQIAKLIAKSKGNSRMVCTANYVKAADKALAIQRAKNACSFANSLGVKFTVSAVAAITKSKSADSTVTILTR